MAGIDKMYGTYEQYKELVAFCKKHPFALNYVYGDYGQYEGVQSISNFSCKIDWWLLRKCPLDFVQERLHDQYGAHAWKSLKELNSRKYKTRMKKTVYHAQNPYGKSYKTKKKAFKKTPDNVPVFAMNNYNIVAEYVCGE